MVATVTSADGTRLAYERLGAGPPVVLLGGMFCDRSTTQPLAELLADRFTVLNPDRRGRGDTVGVEPYAVAREVDDVAALVAAAGGSASVYGHSSGAGLALEAAAAGVPIDRLVLHEPPYGADDDASRASARRLAADIEAALAEDRRGDAIACFLADSGLPPEAVESMRDDPAMQRVAPSMLNDLAVMGDGDRGGSIPVDRVRSIRIPTLVIAGGASPDFFRDTATRLQALLPDGALAVLDGHDHAAPADVVAPVVAAFLESSP